MKAPKISLDSAKLQQLLLQHVEKIVLGVVLLVVAYFVYAGATLPGLDPSKTPDQLSQNAVNVKNEINNPDHWKKLEDERRKNHPIQELVKEGQVPNLSRPYDPKMPLKTPDYAKASLRVDPKIVPPKNAKAVVLHGPLAMIPTPGETDQILLTELAGGAGGEGQVPRQPAMQPPRQPGPGPGPRRQPAGEGRPPRTKQGRQGPGLLEGEGEFQPPPQMTYPGQPGQPGQAGDRSLPPEAIVGFHGGAEVIAKEAQAVVVMAAVPLEQQYEEFDRAFKDALDYNEIRDVPRYVTFRVERADVTADPNQDPDQAKWETLSTKNAAAETLKWGPSPNEVVDINSVDPLILTHRVPPFLQRKIYEALVHPDIPLARPAADPNDPAAVPEAVKPGAGDDEFAGENPLSAQQGGPQAGMREGGGPRLPPNMRMPGPYGPGPRMMQGYGGEGQGPGMSGATEVAPPKYRLVRFTDTTVQPKHKYRYRVRVVVEDPNNPCTTDLAQRMWDPGRTQPLSKPPVQSITENVKKRREMKDREKYPFLLESEPSEPSEVVELPEINHYFAGKITPGEGNAMKPGTPPILRTQPSVNLLTVAWDKDLAVDVPAEKEVYRGSVLNFTQEVEVIHPAKLLIAPIGEHQFKTNSIVVDFAGGDGIPTVDPKAPVTDKVSEPSEILVFDGEGKLQLLDESEDVDGFRRYLPPKPAVPAPTSEGTTIAPADYPGGLLDGPPRPKPNRGGGK